MKLRVYSLNDRFCFSVFNESSQEAFNSAKDYFLTSFAKSTYKYAWKACKDGRNLIKNCSYHIDANELSKTAREDLTKPVSVDVSADTMITDHYSRLLSIMNVKAKGAKGSKKESEKVNKEIQMILGELNGIVEKLTDVDEKRKIRKLIKQFNGLLKKYFGGKKIKTAEVITDDLMDDVLEDYAEKICESLEKKHPGAYYDIAPNGHILIFEPKKSEFDPILGISVNDDFNVDNIIPYGYLRQLYPVHSAKFYQRYWKPIVESIGHFYLDDLSFLIVPDKSSLPDIPNTDSTFTLTGWNKDKKKEECVDLSFRGEKPIWLFNSSTNKKTASKDVSEYTEQDYINAIVECTDPQLKSLYGRTGEVVEIIPHEDYVEVSVDFGRGLGVVRLTESQLRIVPLNNFE
jgi:hypothetical protein